MKNITFCGGTMNGTITAPPSKSCTHRAMLMAALSEGRCMIRNPLISADTSATMDAIRSMGSAVSYSDGIMIIDTEHIHAPNDIIDVRDSGTTMRLMIGISALFDSETVITGDDSVMRRPMGPLLFALSDAGAVCTRDSARVTVKGPISKDSISIDGGMSSQFISSLLMTAPLVGRPVDIIVKGDIISRPYVDITVSMMHGFGIDVKEIDAGFHIEPQRYIPFDYTVPGDFSSATFALAAGGLSGKVSVKGLDMDDQQGDKEIVNILARAGCRIDIDGDTITCSHTKRLKAMDIDLSDTPDLFPIAAVLMSIADGTSRLYGAPQLRYKESDRISSTADMLSSLGADIECTDDGCVIRGVERLKGGRIDHKSDHRLMMSAAIASLASEGPISMLDDTCWNISYPGFIEQMRGIGLRC